MPSAKIKSSSKPSMVVDIYKRYEKRKKQDEDRAWEDDYSYMYGTEPDEKVMENLETAGKIALLAVVIIPLTAVGATACLVRYLFF